MRRLQLLLTTLCMAGPGCDRTGAEAKLELRADPVPTLPPSARSACEIPGVIAAAQTATLEASVSGRVRLADDVTAGTPLEEGQLLATIESREDAGRHAVLDAAWRSAQARAQTQQTDVAAARRKHEQLAPLAQVESRSTLADAEEEVVRTQARHHEARRAVVEATAAREQAEARTDFGALRAPFPGTVVLMLATQGEVVQPGQPVALLRNDSRRVLRFAIDPDAVVGLAAGQMVHYRRTTDGETGTATIQSIPASSDPRTGLVLVEAQLPPDETAREGTSTHVELPDQAPHWCTRAPRGPREPA